MDRVKLRLSRIVVLVGAQIHAGVQMTDGVMMVDLHLSFLPVIMALTALTAVSAVTEQELAG